MRLESRLQELENPESVSAPVTLFDPYQSQGMHHHGSGQASSSGSDSGLGLSSRSTAMGMGGSGGGGVGGPGDIGGWIMLLLTPWYKSLLRWNFVVVSVASLVESLRLNDNWSDMEHPPLPIARAL